MLILPSSFLQALISIHHKSRSRWNNPSGIMIICRAAAAPGPWLFDQNKIHSGLTHIHSWASEDNLEAAGWAFVRFPSAALKTETLWFCELVSSLTPCFWFSAAPVSAALLSVCALSLTLRLKRWTLCLSERGERGMRGGERKREGLREEERGREAWQ